MIIVESSNQIFDIIGLNQEVSVIFKITSDIYLNGFIISVFLPSIILNHLKKKFNFFIKKKSI